MHMLLDKLLIHTCQADCKAGSDGVAKHALVHVVITSKPSCAAKCLSLQQQHDAWRLAALKKQPTLPHCSRSIDTAPLLMPTHAHTYSTLMDAG